MRHCVIFCFFFLLALTPSSPLLGNTRPTPPLGGWSIGLLYSKEDHKHSLGNASNHADIASELHWRDTQQMGLGVEGLHHHPSCLSTYVSLRGSFIVKGRQLDVDYLTPHRHHRFSESLSKQIGGHHLQVKAAIGVWRWLSERSPTALIVLMGVQSSEALYKSRNHIQTFSDPILKPGMPPIGTNLGHCAYRVRTYGPWIGLHLQTSISETMVAAVRVEGAYLVYRGHAKWPDRTFAHKTNALSLKAHVELCFRTDSRYQHYLSVGGEWMTAQRGTFTVSQPQFNYVRTVEGYFRKGFTRTLSLGVGLKF